MRCKRAEHRAVSLRKGETPMKRILITIVLLVAAVAALAAPPRRGAAPGERGAGPRQGQRGPGEVLPPQLLAELLDLTDAQQTQLTALRETQRAAIEPLREQQQANREALEAAVEAGNAQRAGELLIANRGIATQIKAAHDAFKASFEAILTADQKAKFAVFEEIAELRRERRGPRG